MRTAIIDMGTNTFHLLVVERTGTEYKILLRERLPVKIGVGGINQNIITKGGIDRAVNALIQFKNKIDEFRVADVFAFGTSALRNADNSGEVISKIKAATGIHAKIISGDEEAQYIYEGVNLALNLGKEKSLIIDIGGGSVEFIIGNGEKIFWKQSFEIGAQRLLERFQKHDPILTSEIESVMDFLKESLSPLFDAMKIHSPEVLAGSSGTFDTLSDIHCIQSGIEQKDSPETPLTLEAFKKIYPEIISKNRVERMQIPGMIEMRVEMIVVACCLVKFILDHFHFRQIRVSSYSLKEGVLASLLKKKS
ncbi:MAG: phosphatase [Bacteroidetes bacterium]|nr:phosphatase [Bacteroidota bacterium]